MYVCRRHRLRPNAKKSGSSAILYGLAHQQGKSPISEEMVQTSQRLLADVRLADRSLPFYHPHTDPYRYLGVEMTLTLNWKYQISTVIANVAKKAGAISTSLCSPSQQIQYIQSSIRPYLTYSFPLAAYSLHDIRRLDAAIARVAKRAYGISLSTPTHFILQEKDKVGMGVDSLMLDYCQLGAAALARALNDKGPLGRSTKALLKAQHKIVAGMPNMCKANPTLSLGKATRHLHLVKQLSLLREVELQIRAGTVPD